MTILVGLLCEDGIVIGSDSSATLGAAQIRTIEQRCKKIEIINNEVIVAGTGAAGLGQRFNHIVEMYWSERRNRSKPFQQIGVELSASTIQNFGSTGVRTGTFGSLVAFPLGRNFHLCEFGTEDFQPEFKTEHLWYVSMGSGQLITDPFLGLLRRVFWDNKPPKLNEGIFYVTWAIQNAIELNPGGINGPIKIATLSWSNQQNKLVARFLEDDELEEHRNMVVGAIQHLAKFKDILQGNAEKQIPEVS